MHKHKYLYPSPVLSVCVCIYIYIYIYLENDTKWKSVLNDTYDKFPALILHI